MALTSNPNSKYLYRRNINMKHTIINPYIIGKALGENIGCMKVNLLAPIDPNNYGKLVPVGMFDLRQIDISEIINLKNDPETPNVKYARAPNGTLIDIEEVCYRQACRYLN